MRSGWWLPALIIAAVVLIFASAARAGVDSPLAYPTIGQLAEDAAVPGERCPRLTNPIECGSHKSRKHHHEDLKRRHLLKQDQCQMNRDVYMYHHGARLSEKPRALRGYIGCELYARDRAFHAALTTFPDTMQEAVERIMDDSGVSAQSFSHLLLTERPQA